MARKVQMDASYIFVPSANRITIDKAIPQEKLLLITNLSSNTVIYNFSDNNLRVSTYTRTRETQIAVTGTPGTTSVTNLWPSITPIVGQRINGYGIPANTYISSVTGTTLTLSNAITADPYTNQHTPSTLFGTVIVLNYNTSGMNSSDKLQIFIDEYDESFRPSETLMDPVSKQRVSEPESLIDTDFEYGLQPTKWETCQLIGNRPSYFYNNTTPINNREISITSGGTSRTINVDSKILLSGTHTTTTGAQAVTGVGTRYLTELKTGSVLYDNTGVFIGYVSSVTNDTSATLKANGAVAITGATALATGQRFNDNGAPGSGIFSPSGRIDVATGSTAVVANGTGTLFLSQLRVGDYLYSGTGALIGVIASIASDTSLTLAANSLVTATNIFFGTSQYSISTSASANPIFVQLTTNPDANGSFLITGPTTLATTIGAATIFSYDMEVNAIVPSTNIATTAASGSGTIATLTFAAQTVAPYSVGSTILVSGVTPSAYNTPVINGSSSGAQVLSCSTTQVTYLSSGTGSQTVAGNITSLTILDSPSTYAYPGTFFSSSQIGGSTQASFATDNATNNSIITVTTGTGHNLLVGNPIFVTGASNTACNGNWYVARVVSPTVFEYVIQSQSSTITTAAQGRVYARQLGNVLHRPTDGGVKITAGTNSPGAQLIRQTRRYFRYQSGKGIQYSTGTIFKPSILVDSLSSDGTRVTVTCKDAHNLYPGASITISGATATSGTFNGTYTVDVTGLTITKFTYIPSSVPTSQTAGGFPINVCINSWVGAQNRLGMFDSQNGIYFKFDGTTLFACRRSSTDQLPGTLAVINGSSAVVGTGTRFTTLLKPGNMVVIRGMSYTVTQITSDTTMNISPEYRGTTITSGVKITKTIDLEIPQSDWNIDRCDGTGPSGFNLDLTRMQMWYLDYSWYGAGAIRYGFKDQRGEVIYCNRISHANSKTEAYMRSGNLPARYETNTMSYSTTLSATLSSATTVGGTVSVADASQFPSSGFVYINPSSSTNSGLGELIEYSSKNTAVSPNTLTIASRALAGVAASNSTTTTGSNIVTNAVSFATTVQKFMHVHGSGIPVGTYVVGVSGTTVYLSNAATATSSTASLVFKSFAATAAQTYTYNASTPVGVSFYNPQFAPNISHWGSSAIMDGKYDNDKALVFTGGMPTSSSIPAATQANTAGQPVALISIRISPSVDTGIGDILGRKEIVNRMQLQLNSAGISTDRRLLVDLRLNGQVSGGSWQSLGGSSLAQVCYHTNTGGGSYTSISGGESVYSFFTSSQGNGVFDISSIDLTKVRDLGNSILGGGTSLNVNSGMYPDGPDTLTIVARNLETTAGNAVARISWTEAQA
jgi:hypothetical protein